MRIKTILKTAVMLFAMIFLLSDAFGLPSSGTAGHGDLSTKSAEIKYNLPESEINGLRDSLKDTFGSLKDFQDFLSSANISEDQPAVKGMFHFYDPITGSGYKGMPYNAKDRAYDYYRYAINDYCIGKYRNDPNLMRKAWADFGHVQHLMQDMVTPAHTNNISHISGDSFEDYVRDNWDQWQENAILGYQQNLLTGELEPITGPLPDNAKIIKSLDASGAVYYSGIKEYLDDYMAQVQYNPGTFQRPEYFDFLSRQSHYEPVDTPTPGAFPLLEKDLISWQQRRQNAETLLPMAMMYGAGLINTFWSDISKTDANGIPDICKLPPALITPGGDNPDDRFDVSDGFYLEENFKLPPEKQVELSLRTGIKKNKGGIVYYKQAIDTYAAGVNAATDAEKRAADKKLNEMGKITIPDAGRIQADIKTAPDVALFSYGFHDAMTSLFLKYKEPITFIGTDFDPAIVKDHPILVVPSGGLYSLENSTFLKTQLEEYVKNGGTLIVFAQQHGYELNVLPVPQETDGSYKQITGYGWAEDQSCFTNAVYIDTRHQMLSSINKATPTLSVDGYFTNYPSNTTILLRRTANGQPAMIMYEHGLGKVIVSSMYSDFAMSHNQASTEELALIRDMIAWAKKPATLPEIKPGEAVSLSVSVKNVTTTDAASSKFLIYNPDRTTVVSEQFSGVSIPAGSSAQFLTQYASPVTASLGIYHTDYELYDANGVFIQPQAETDSGRFVVSNPPKTGIPEKPIWFSVSTTSQQVIFGTPFNYTFHVFNSTNESRNLKVKALLPHTYRTHEWDITATANSETTITSSDLFLDTQWMYETLRAYLYDETGKDIGSYMLSFKGSYPSANITSKTDKLFYGKGQNVQIDTTLKDSSRISSNYQPEVKITVSGPGGVRVFEETRTLNFTSNRTAEVITRFVLRPNSDIGTYTIRAEAWYGSAVISSATISFDLLESQISVTPSMATAVVSGNNLILFTLNNTGKINISSGFLDISVREPDGIVAYSVRQPFALAIGESKILEVPVTIPPLKLGNYVITYTQSDETRTGQPASIAIPNTVAITGINLDKISYKVRETANIAINIANYGKFNLETVPVALSVPDLGYEDVRTISIPSSGNSQLTFSVSIPDTVTAGMHDVNITMTLSPGSSIARSSAISIPESSLTIGYSGPSTVKAGDVINLTIQNTGGFDTTYTTEKLSITDDKGIEIYQGSLSGIIMAGEQKTLADFLLPAQTTNGFVYLNFRVRDNNTAKLFDFNKPLAVSGVAATVQSKTDKDVYLKTEAITSLSTVVNGQFEIENGNLNVSVQKMKNSGTGKFSHFLPLKGWASFYNPYAVAIAPDGSIYVADTYNYRVQKFDANGNFIVKWGSYGFDPTGVAIASDGSVYIVDAYNYRIQKFDGNGNFISKWGSYGNGDGQFNSPRGITVGPDGFIYVTDVGRDNIQKFDANGNFVSAWGNFGKGDGQFNYPWGIAVDFDGSIYVTDLLNNCIQKFDNSGAFIKKWGIYGSSAEQFMYPNGITISPEGLLYVVDSGNKKIKKFDNNGVFISLWGTYGRQEGQLEQPSGIAAARDGSVFVTDINSNYIQKFGGSGEFVFRIGDFGTMDEKFNSPSGLVTASDGSIYVADCGNNRIQRFSNNGNFITKWGGPGILNGQFSSPRDIALDPNNFVYVVEGAYNYRIQKFDVNGNFISILGDYYCDGWVCRKPTAVAVGADGNVYAAYSGYSGYYNLAGIQKYDSSGKFISGWGSYGKNNGQFSNISGLAVSSDGFVYVVDSGNYRIQKFDSNGNFITKWGQSGYGDGYFGSPSEIAVDIVGAVYVSDYGRRNVQKFDSNGGYITKWSGPEKEGFDEPYGISITSDGTIYVADSGDHRILKMSPSGSGLESLFETTIPITQPANAVQNHTMSIGTLNTIGKLYLKAELKNNLGQNIAAAEYPFYIMEGNTLLVFTTDKKIYRPGDTVAITGEVRNVASVAASGLTLSLNSQQGTQNSQLLTESFDVPANGDHSFTVTTAASTEGTYTLKGKITQNNSTLVEIADNYEVAKPKVTATITSPDITGDNSFAINLELNNEGKTETNVRLSVLSNQGNTIDNQQLIIQPGETRVLQYHQQITTNTTYTFMFTGDLEQTIAKTVTYGLAAQIQFDVQNSIHAEGKIAMPVTIANTGQLDVTAEVNFQLSSQQTAVSSFVKTYFIPKGGSVADILYYDLTEGSYQLTASSSQPEATANANFSVKKENNVTLDVAIGTQTNELIPATVNLTNLGYNSIDGSVRLSVISSQGADVWHGVQDVAQLLTLNSKVLTFNVNPSALESGDYTVKAELLNSSNQQLAVSSQLLTIRGPVFQITQLPPYQTFTAGQEATFRFKVKNTGNQEGAPRLNLKAYDLIDSTRREWLKPGEEKEISFSFLLPDDLETKDYFADYELRADDGQLISKGQSKYHLAGLSLAANAVLDKQNYSKGETAHLTINIHSTDPNPQLLFARVNYAGYELQRAFTLTSTSTLTFDIPLTKITGEKLFYGIYYKSGRSIHLNSVYIYKAGDVITITSDKQVYNPGEQVSVLVSSVGGATGTLTLTAPDYEETFNFTGTATKNFTLPSTMMAGTYTVNAELKTGQPQETAPTSIITVSHPFDVAGIQVKVLECKNDKGKYASSDTIATSFTISSNKDMTATLKTWIIDPEGKYTNVGESNIKLSSSENLLFSESYSLKTAVSGIHRLVYGIYSGDKLLVSSSEAFDVGDAVLLGLSTDKTDYPTNSETVTVSMSVLGTVGAELEVQIDGASVKTESVFLNGFKASNYELSAILPGTHVLKGILTAGGLHSSKETSFVYGSSLPDLTTAVSSQQSTVSKESTIQLTATAVNQGKTPSNATALSLYDNDNLIETVPVKALGSGASLEITLIWNVLGKAGEHVIKAIIDPDNAVIEFNEGNNTSTINIVVPDITLMTGTDRDTYKIGQNVNILSSIEDLNSSKTFDSLTIVTAATDAKAHEVYKNIEVISNIQPLSINTNAVVWNTTGLSADGVYTISQQALSGSQVLAQSTKSISLRRTSDFNLTADTDYKRVRQGEKTTYKVHLDPLDGWSSGIALNLLGVPDGTSVSFNPANLIPPGESLTMVITTNATVPGIYDLKLTAEGTDEGETITHELPLTLDVSGFGVNAVISSQTIKQLETATFSILLDSRNGYEGEVALSLAGLPYGIKSTFDKMKVQVPGEVMLTVLTSKYIKPGIYELTIMGNDGLAKHSLDLMITVDANPAISEGIITTPGPGPKNPSSVSLISEELRPLFEFAAFDSNYGAYAASADIDGDGYNEVVVAQGPGPQNSATLRVFKRDGTLLTEVVLFDTKYGMTLSSGDIDGDWKDEIIAGIGPGPGNPATLKVMKYHDGGLIELTTKTLPYNLQYGLNTVLGDIDGDGIPEIITSPGPGPDNPATITIWKQAGNELTEFKSFTVFGGTYGANISTGDIDGDGVDEIITGTGPDPKNRAIVRGYKADGTNLLEFVPYGAKYTYGVTVASADIDEDGIDEIITGLGPGPQNPSWVKIFKSDGKEIAGFMVYPENGEYGVKVFSGRVGK